MKIIRWIVKLLIVALLASVMAVMYYSYTCIKSAPKINVDNIDDVLMENSFIYDDKGEKIDTIYSEENRTNVTYDQLPENLVNAFIALEDKTFREHSGFNLIRMAGAVKSKFASGGQVSGTSTITQQLARNVYLKDTMMEHSIKRKIIEAWYTIILERNVSKEKIMEAYLNTINLGFGNYGVESASQSYFHKHVKDLSLEQCAALASLPQAPSEYAMVQLLEKDAHPKHAKVLHKDDTGVYVMNDEGKERRELCLDLMKEQGYINQEEHDQAISVPLKDMLDPTWKKNDSGIAYFTDYAIEQVIDDLCDEKNMTREEAWNKVYGGGLRIYTTVDRKAQKAIQKEFKKSSNFPSQTNINYDYNGNILNKYGQIMLYKKSNIISGKKFKFKKNEIQKNADGSLLIKKNKRLNIYKTEVNGETDYSIEFPGMYKFKNGKLYSTSGGYLNIPQSAKKKTKKGNIIISAEFLKTAEGKDTFRKTKNGKYYIPKKHYTVNQYVMQPQAAMTIIENKTGQIKAMVGGRKTTGKMLYNRATEPRQPGSSIKPLAVYSAALQQSVEEAREGKTHDFIDYHIDRQGTSNWGDWITAGSTCIDERTTNNGKTWPENAGGGYSGYNTLRTAIKNSINTCAYKIFMQVGTEYSIKMLKKYGISTLATDSTQANDMNAAALSLGGMTNGVTTLDMANAYTAFANKGKRAKTPVCYTKVLDSEGNVVLENKEEKVKVLDEGVAWIMADMMKGVVSGGTGTAAYIDGIQVGGKTGTTTAQNDIWFDGFTPKYSASLWIGNDVNISLTSMSEYAAALWGKIMRQVPGVTKGKYPSKPEDVEYCGGEYYVKGTY